MMKSPYQMVYIFNRREHDEMDNLEKIDALRNKLINSASDNAFDFQHPAVLEVSKELDQLIVEWMRSKKQKDT